ncbi:ribonuclease domain-containing protein [Tomitella gaofuii]|uniref:ribonuclease domain-containing protein n=1 Tax=Tomitella gaofuii TaxID=2760083 RepID=UPI0015F9728C|nr:ribonuclease domain-containing protein [Tomitella gaofuii]
MRAERSRLLRPVVLQSASPRPGRVAALLVALVAVVAALLAGCAPAAPGNGAAPGAHAAADAGSDPAVPGVPDAAWRTLALIDAGDWPEAADAPGTRGGQRFGNREKRLPERDVDGDRIRYREWDVNPRKPGQGRDAERIVTGDEGSAWYTGDHYATFTRMR